MSRAELRLKTERVHYRMVDRLGNPLLPNFN